VHWPHPRRLILLRHCVADRPTAAASNCSRSRATCSDAGASFPASVPPLAGGATTTAGRTGENVIKELQHGFALPTLCLHRSGHRGRLVAATLTYNLTVLFSVISVGRDQGNDSLARFWLFVTPESSRTLPAKPRSNSPSARERDGGRDFGKNPQPFPSAMQWKIDPFRRLKSIPTAWIRAYPESCSRKPVE